MGDQEQEQEQDQFDTGVSCQKKKNQKQSQKETLKKGNPVPFLILCFQLSSYFFFESTPNQPPKSSKNHSIQPPLLLSINRFSTLSTPLSSSIFVQRK